MIIAETMREVRQAARGVVGLVPTMGFLHEGHLGCVAAIRGMADLAVMSVFVNPIQFDSPSDLERYPRDLDRDVGLAEGAGVDVLFVPGDGEMYRQEPVTRVQVSGVTDAMEGAYRPGHFDGVATVVAKLLAGIRPDLASFGRKDAQQLAVVTTMVRDLSFPVEIVAVSTVREQDGLALSSRNVRIPDRKAALGLSRGLFAAADAAAVGERDGAALEQMVRETASAAGATVQYVTLADRHTARPIGFLDRDAFLAVAATVGDVRLIDNVFLDTDGTADRGTRLEGRSVLYGDAP
ncbi:MAG TPA: pantoate--beta-alanine ligase [Acidimicrobiia bacterium]|nr:pantoate--beta-alanine ligase [Acidimicrobiia bacterium]